MNKQQVKNIGDPSIVGPQTKLLPGPGASVDPRLCLFMVALCTRG